MWRSFLGLVCRYRVCVFIRWPLPLGGYAGRLIEGGSKPPSSSKKVSLKLILPHCGDANEVVGLNQGCIYLLLVYSS